jgi:DNA-binding winged helix-turn-helix (wHTH) protein
VKLLEYIDLVEDLTSAVLNGDGHAASSLAQTVRSLGRDLRSEALAVD